MAGVGVNYGNIVGWSAKYVDLQIEHDVPNQERHITRQAERLVDVTISGHHIQPDGRVVVECKSIADLLRHSDYLAAGVQDGFDLVLPVDGWQDRVERS